MSNITAMLNWMHNMTGKVRYSMAYRHSPGYEDCSSAVFRALIAGGFRAPGSLVGSTETLFQLRGTLLTPISRSQIQAGDVFVSGTPGGSAGAAGHTGFALNATQAIHCSSRFNGIGISSNADSAVSAYGRPVYWFRLTGAAAPSPTPEDPSEDDIMITDINGGKEYVSHKQLIELFGVRMEMRRFDDVTSARDLLEKAKDELANQPLELQSLSIDFAQLYKNNNRPNAKQYRKLKIGDVVTVRNDELNVNQRMRIRTLSFDISESSKGSADMGRQRKTLERWVVDASSVTNFNQSRR